MRGDVDDRMMNAHSSDYIGLFLTTVNAILGVVTTAKSQDKVDDVV